MLYLCYCYSHLPIDKRITRSKKMTRERITGRTKSQYFIMKDELLFTFKVRIKMPKVPASSIGLALLCPGPG